MRSIPDSIASNGFATTPVFVRHTSRSRRAHTFLVYPQYNRPTRIAAQQPCTWSVYIASALKEQHTGCSYSYNHAFSAISSPTEEPPKSSQSLAAARGRDASSARSALPFSPVSGAATQDACAGEQQRKQLQQTILVTTHEKSCTNNKHTYVAYPEWASDRGKAGLLLAVPTTRFQSCRRRLWWNMAHGE